MTSTLIKKLRQVFTPTYGELTLFALSYTCILFFASEALSIFGGDNFVPSLHGVGPVVLMLILTSGVGLSLYHSLSKKKKGRLEKQVMFMFAAIMNGFSGIWGGTYILSNSDSWTWHLIFPIFNIISSYLIFSQTRYRILDDDCIDDADVSLIEVAISALIISLAFLITHQYFHLHWSATLSICVVFGTNLQGLIVNFLLPEKTCVQSSD